MTVFTTDDLSKLGRQRGHDDSSIALIQQELHEVLDSITVKGFQYLACLFESDLRVLQFHLSVDLYNEKLLVSVGMVSDYGESSGMNFRMDLNEGFLKRSGKRDNDNE